MSEPDNPDDGREHERKDVLFGARLYAGKDGMDCEIINISFGGAQVRVGGALNKGDMVVLKMEPFGSFNMEVRWFDGKDAGVRFDDDPAKVAELVMAIATYA